MAVDDSETLKMPRAQEVAPDPSQILLPLPLKRQSWPDAGMREDIIAADDEVFSAPQKLLMGRRDEVWERKAQLLERGALIFDRVKPITDQAGLASSTNELTQGRDIAVKGGDKHLFMIALQPMKRAKLIACLHGPLDNGL